LLQDLSRVKTKVSITFKIYTEVLPFQGCPMTTLQIELPETTAIAARAAGLLTPQALDRLLMQALRRREAADALLAVADRVAAAGITPMLMQEISAEVKAVRADRSRGAQPRAKQQMVMQMLDGVLLAEATA
jgi:hypothetical protein